MCGKTRSIQFCVQSSGFFFLSSIKYSLNTAHVHEVLRRHAEYFAKNSGLSKMKPGMQ